MIIRPSNRVFETTHMKSMTSGFPSNHKSYQQMSHFCDNPKHQLHSCDNSKHQLNTQSKLPPTWKSVTITTRAIYLILFLKFVGTS
jgi:hypothetical protein